MTLELLGKACMMVVMNITIFRVILGGTYGIIFGYLAKEFGLTAGEMTALLMLSVTWLIAYEVLDPNRVRSTQKSKRS